MSNKLQQSNCKCEVGEDSATHYPIAEYSDRVLDKLNKLFYRQISDIHLGAPATYITESMQNKPRC